MFQLHTGAKSNLRLDPLKRVRGTVSLYLCQPPPRWHRSEPSQPFSACDFPHEEKWGHVNERSASTAVQNTAKDIRFLLTLSRKLWCATQLQDKEKLEEIIARALWGHRINTNCFTDSIRKLALELLGTPCCRSPQGTHGLHPPLMHLTHIHLNAVAYSLCISLMVVTASLCRRLLGMCRKLATGNEHTNLRFSTTLGKASQWEGISTWHYSTGLRKGTQS